MNRETTYYAQRDGVDVAGKRHDVGDKVDVAELHPAIVTILEQSGQIGTQPPAGSSVLLNEGPQSVDDMSREALVAEALDITRSRVGDMSTDDLRAMIAHYRDERGDPNPESKQDDRGAGDDSIGGTPYADLKDKPLASLKTADLDTIAREEGVSFDGARTNADRVAAIEAKRAAS